jgi:hypothetical protein
MDLDQGSASVDEFGGDVAVESLEARTKSAYLGEAEAPAGTDPKPSAEGEKDSAAQPNEEEAVKPEDSKVKAEDPGESQDDKAKTEEEKDKDESPEDLPDDAESSEKLRLALAQLEKRARGLNKVAADKGRENKRLNQELQRRAGTEQAVEQLLQRKPDLIDRLSELLEEGDVDKKKAETKQEIEDISEDQLSQIVDELPEVKPLVDALKNSMKREATFSELVQKLEDRINRMEGDTKESGVQAQQAKIEKRRYDWYGALHNSYDALRLPKDIDPATLDEMIVGGILDVTTDPHTGQLKTKDQYWQKVLDRAGEVARIVEFAEKGPYGKGTAEEPYYPDIEMAYEALLRMGGKAHTERAKFLIRGRKEAAQALAEAGTKAPSIAGIKGKDRISDTSKNPESADEARTWMDDMVQKLNKEDREMTDEEQKLYESMQRRFNL